MLTQNINTKLLLNNVTLENVQRASKTLSNSYRPLPTTLDKIKVVIDEHGTFAIVCDDNFFGLTEWAFTQFCQLINVPKSYIMNCNNQFYYALLYDNINTWLKHYGNKEIVLLIYDNCIHGFVTKRYLRISHEKVINSIQCHKEFNQEFNFVSYTQTPEFLHMRFISKEPFVIDHTGSPLFVGYYIQNSEVGCSSLYMDTFIYRQVCTNGLTIPKFSKRFYKKHVGATYDLCKLDLSLNSILQDEDSKDICELIVRSQNAKIAHETALSYLKTQKLTELELTTIKPISCENNTSYYNLFDFVNIITDHAKTYNLEKRLKSESFAGDILKNHVGAIC